MTRALFYALHNLALSLIASRWAIGAAFLIFFAAPPVHSADFISKNSTLFAPSCTQVDQKGMVDFADLAAAIEKSLEVPAFDCDTSDRGASEKARMEKEFKLYVEVLGESSKSPKHFDRYFRMRDALRERITNRLLTHRSNCFTGLASLPLVCAQLPVGHPIIHPHHPGRIEVRLGDGKWRWENHWDPEKKSISKSWVLKRKGSDQGYAVAHNRDSDLAIERVERDQGFEITHSSNDRDFFGSQWSVRETNANAKKMLARDVPLPDALHGMAHDETRERVLCLAGLGNPSVAIALSEPGNRWSPEKQLWANRATQVRQVFEGTDEGKRAARRDMVYGFGKRAWDLGGAVARLHEGTVDVLSTLMAEGYFTTQELGAWMTKTRIWKWESLAKVQPCLNPLSGLSVRERAECLRVRSGEQWEKLVQVLGEGFRKAEERTFEALDRVQPLVGAIFKRCRDQHGFMTPRFIVCAQVTTNQASMAITAKFLAALAEGLKEGMKKCVSDMNRQFAECMGGVVFDSLMLAAGSGAGILAKAQAAKLPAGSLGEKALEGVSKVLGSEQTQIEFGKLGKWFKGEATDLKGKEPGVPPKLDSVPPKLDSVPPRLDSAPATQLEPPPLPAGDGAQPPLLSESAGAKPPVIAEDAAATGAPKSPSQPQAQPPGDAQAKFPEAKPLGAIPRGGLDLGPIKVFETEVEPMSKAVFKALRAREKRYYVVDLDGNLSVVKELPKAESDTGLLLIKSKNDTNSFAVREAGEIQWDSKTGKVTFDPSRHSMGDDEVKQALDRVSAEHNVPFERRAAVGVAKETVLTCLDLKQQGASLKKYLFDNLISMYAVNGATLAIGEYTGANRFSNEDDIQTVLAENVSNTVTNPLFGLLGWSLYRKSNLSAVQKSGIRTVAGLGMLYGIKVPTMKHLTQEGLENADIYPVPEGESPPEASAAEKIAAFDTGHMMAMTPIDLIIDEKVFLRAIPDYLFERCRKGEKLNIVLSTLTGAKALRIYQRTANSYVYFELREALINE